MGNRTRVENVSGGNTRVTNSTPNELNQISALSQSVNGAPATTSGFGYDAAGNTTLIESADGGKMLFTYDDAEKTNCKRPFLRTACTALFSLQPQRALRSQNAFSIARSQVTLGT